MRAVWAILAFLFCCLTPTSAHDIPRSQIELRLGTSGVEATVTFSVLGFSLDYPALQLGGQALEKVVTENRTQMAEAVATRLGLIADEQRLTPEALTPERSEFLPERKAIRLYLSFRWLAPPKHLEVRTGSLFPVDPNHTVFVTLYEAAHSDVLLREAVLNHTTPSLSYALGSKQSLFSVIRQFIREGIHHIFIGPDHILFVIGLLLLGGNVKRLLKIITAFTLAHSITLVLATLNLVTPSPRLIEPLIALSIVFVGIHALSQLSQEAKQRSEKDLRLTLAFFFGLIHGFGFASVLRELELPREALGWSLFSFNVGVELGQACIVITVAQLLSWLRRKNEKASCLIVFIASWCVVLAGAYWFGERLFA